MRNGRMEKTKSLKKFIYDKVDQFQKYPYYARAKTIHKNHKGDRLKIYPGHFLEQIYKDDNWHIVIRKATQVGISEYLLVRAFYRAEIGRSVFYVMPTYELKNQFVKDRIDKSIMMSEYYQRLLSESMVKSVESMSLKQIGKGTIAFVGSNTANAFISFQADDVIRDEYDNCNQQNILMAEERQSASKDKTIIDVGNPTIQGFGIDELYQQSCQYQWHIKCPHCSEWFTPDFFKDVVEQIDKGDWTVRDPDWEHDFSYDPKVYCPKCGKPYDRFSTGEWIAMSLGGRASGYWISKMFSTQNTVNDLLDRFLKGLVNDHSLQRFYNGDLGIPFTSTGSRIDEIMLNDCIGDYSMPESSNGYCIAGIDVGSMLHITIGELKDDKKVQIVFVGEVREFEEARDILKRYSVRSFVIDAMPEGRASIKLIRRFKFGFMCYYVAGKKELTIDPVRCIINTLRTEAIDAVKEHLLLKNIIYPRNIKSIPGYYEQMTSSIRIYNEEGNKYTWEHGNAPDHYLHSCVYMILARRLFLMER
jgi:hypothetical protein